MAAIRGRDTRPERIVRSLAHRLGYRFRLHRRDLPGVPDLVFPRLRKIVFVHGCFWHLHACRYGRVKPANNASFWAEKRRENQARDRRNIRALQRAGWQVLVIWECEVRDLSHMEEVLQGFLGSGYTA